MEAEAPSASQLGRTHTPESLRQRQRDRLSPRGRFATKSRTSANVRERGMAQKSKITLSPAPKPKTAATRPPNSLPKNPLQDGSRTEDGVGRRARRDVENMRSELTPDGGSAGREGRHFTVAKVGNNGRIYLRPTIRPAVERFPQPSFVFPITPPSTAGLDALTSRPQDDDTEHDSLWTPTRLPSTVAGHNLNSFLPPKVPNQTSRPQRSHSFSTVDEHNLSVPEPTRGGIKVVIERPGAGPKKDAIEGVPTLEVPIPSYKLGVPRFSARGTAFLRGSYTTTATADDVRSSVLTKREYSRDFSSHRPTQILSRRHSDASPQPYFPVTAPNTTYDASLRSPGGSRKSLTIVPEIFDALTFKPLCDHPSVVRYSIHGTIKAATPARLVAEITSPTFVDYDLLSDFFLTFRSFMEPMELLCMLIARLKWALSRIDETGTVVRVRTFVAIRHWILNYFLDDFVVDYDLRTAFCDLLNHFVREQYQDSMPSKSPLKILAELKKCWRRVCALYWDGPDFDTELGAAVPIVPGGVAGSRNPKLDPSFWATHPDGPPKLEGIIEPETVVEERNFFADVSRAGHLDSVLVGDNNRSDPADEPPLSPSSIVSETFVSCSFPTRQRTIGTTQPRGAHPVASSSVYDSYTPVAATPKALTGKRVRPNHSHKRSASFSDSYRDRRVPQQPVQKVIFKSTELLLAIPYAGSLVRGNLFPPGQPFVEIVAPRTPAQADQATTLYARTPHQKGPSAMSGPGMKKLLGSVRRALSSRNGPSPNASPTQGSFPHIPPIGIRGVTINRLPGTAVVPQARPRNASSRSPMRIDLLGAEVAEDFKKAVKEDTDAEAEQRKAVEIEPLQVAHNPNLEYSAFLPDASSQLTRPDVSRAAFSEMTNGSKSIVIVDDTFTLEPPPFMTGALPNPSVDTFAEAFMQPSGGPTPPSTPPEVPLGTPRRSSHLLGHHTRNKSSSFEQTPSLVVDSRPSGEEEPSPSHRPQGRLALPPSRGLSYRSKRSTSLRRYASYHSGFTRDSRERSFDATTFSEAEDIERLSHIPSVPLPLRPLRRRPGGDLRAVNTVEDLNTHSLRRPISTGSLTTYSESVRSSYLLNQDSSEYVVDVVSSDYDQSQRNIQAFSLGQLADNQPKHRVSLFSTHSSQPAMRPSFEKEAQMLAQIPDDDDDDGGVESALLKLEGKFEKRHSDISAKSQTRSFPELTNSFGLSPQEDTTISIVDNQQEEEEKRRHRQRHIVERTSSKTPPIVATYQPQQIQSIDSLKVEPLKPVAYQPRGFQAPPPLVQSPRSIESYNSIPLLERGLTDDGDDHRRNWSGQSILRELSAEGRDHELLRTPESSHVNSYDFIDETESMKKIPEEKGHRSKQSVGESFLDSESDGESDISSELSMEVISKTELTENDFTSAQTSPPGQVGAALDDSDWPLQPNQHPPSPQMTLLQALKLSPDSAYQRQVPELRTEYEMRPLPPTPEITPTAPYSTSKFVGHKVAASSLDPLRSNQVTEAPAIPEASRKTSVHLPFILAFDSQILAQQFTLIEKDALNEIDWKDLIEMRWKDSSTESRSWVDFLRSQEPHGVEVVIARFNLMVKWAVSECVLTQDMGERIRCIIKFIHIAAHCRKYRNFATMTQITVALTSKDLSRLTKTWAHVPVGDIQTLRDLEALVTPMHNFHNLRAEMEGSGADQGCIPFVGIYTHDLLVNFERPSQIASTPTTEPLVNFERCRTDATIVKNLLRLLEASQLYRFLPIEGITERCLWMAALSDEEISKYGKMIQE